MRKIMIMLSVVLALVACSKEASVKDASNGASKLVINITVNYSEVTKAVKSGWEEGDKVYIFFDGVTGAKYLELTRDGSAWTHELKGGLLLSDLKESGDKMYGVFFPYEQPVIAADGDEITFKTAAGLSIYTYYMTGSGEYTVNKSADIVTLAGSMEMYNPDGYVQFYIDKDGDKYNSDGKYRLSVEGVKPRACVEFSTYFHTFSTKTLSSAQPMWGYKYGDGVAFSGVIDESWSNGENVHEIFLFDTEAAAKERIVLGKTLASHDAIKLSVSSWNSYPFYNSSTTTIGGTKWGNKNLGGSMRFSWGDIIPAWNRGTDYSYWNTAVYEALTVVETVPSLTDEYAIYDMVTAFLGPEWRLPTKDEFVALCNEPWHFEEDNSLVVGSLAFPASGELHENGYSLHYYNYRGFYWSSTRDHHLALHPYCLIFARDQFIHPDDYEDYRYAMPVRPVHK